MVRGRSPKARRLQASRISDAGRTSAACSFVISPTPASDCRGLCFGQLGASKHVSIAALRFGKPVLAMAIGALSIALPACAADIRITGGNCASAVHVVARDAALSDVLRRLAKALDFELVDGGASDASVSVDVARRPVDLIASLAGNENVSMTVETNPRCPRRERIVKLWILPGRQATPVRTRPSAAQAEQARREQEGIDMVMRAHGMPTPQSPATKTR